MKIASQNQELALCYQSACVYTNVPPETANVINGALRVAAIGLAGTVIVKGLFSIIEPTTVKKRKNKKYK